ncbi:MAG: hypothetical protein V3W41_22980 [Planctomycetota bacterium]
MKSVEVEMRAALAGFDPKVESLRAYASRTEVGYSRLIYWRNRLSIKPAMSKQKSKGSAFVAVKLDTADLRGGGARSVFKIEFGGSLQLSVSNGFDSKELCRLLGVLRS